MLNSPNTPTLFSYESSQGPVGLPVWTYFHDEKFYIFSGKTSKKVQAIESGKNKVSLIFLNLDGYPMPLPDEVNYYGLRGIARIVRFEDVERLDEIHLDLLNKYDKNCNEVWIRNLVDKIQAQPKLVWMVEVEPINYFSG